MTLFQKKKQNLERNIQRNDFKVQLVEAIILIAAGHNESIVELLEDEELIKCTENTCEKESFLCS
jgi:hypothetical protein